MIATRPSNWGHCRLLSSLVRQPGVRLTNAPAANHTRMRDTSSQAYTAGASPDKSAPPIASHEAVGVRYVGLRAEHSIHESGLDVGLRLGRPVYSACRMGPSGNRHELDPPLRPWRAGASTDRRNGLTSLTGGSAAGDATREPRPPSRAAIVKRQPSGCLPTMAPPTLPRRPAGAVGRQQAPAAVVVVPDPPRRAARL